MASGTCEVADEVNKAVAALRPDERLWLTKFVRWPGARNAWWDNVEVEALLKGRIVRPSGSGAEKGKYLLTAYGEEVAKACEELRQAEAAR